MSEQVLVKKPKTKKKAKKLTCDFCGDPRKYEIHMCQTHKNALTRVMGETTTEKKG